MNIKFNHKSNNYRIDVYKYMLMVTKHHFACDYWDFRWLFLDYPTHI